jgi:poly-gamma-glutamate synthesis protein (capsule biosynthesis protein)
MIPVVGAPRTSNNRCRCTSTSLLVAAVVAGLASIAPAAGGTPAFHGTSAPIPAEFRAHMTSWHPGCPVPLDALRLLTLTYWGFDGRVHTGRLVVARAQGANVLRAMRTIFEARFPIRRMRLIEAYGASDDRSLAADNTAGFNCRYVAGTHRWSAHAYGLAIDIDPLENPYVVGAHVSPPAGRRFLDRSLRVPGVIHPGDVVVRAFATIGWKWGGYWTSPKDYQHFSATGN